MSINVTGEELLKLLRQDGYFIKFISNKVYFGASHILELVEMDLEPKPDYELAEDLLEWSGLHLEVQLRR